MQKNILKPPRRKTTPIPADRVFGFGDHPFAGGLWREVTTQALDSGLVSETKHSINTYNPTLDNFKSQVSIPNQETNKIIKNEYKTSKCEDYTD